MSDEEPSNDDFTKQKQGMIADSSNQIMNLGNTVLEIKSLIAQFKQQQSSGPFRQGLVIAIIRIPERR